MYFDDTPSNEWILKNIFNKYYESNGNDPVKTLNDIKQDLIAFVNKPNLLSTAKKRGESLLNNWNRIKTKLLSYQPATDKDKENSQPSNTPATSVTNNITNRDSATFNQSINVSLAQPASNTLESSQLEQTLQNNEKKRKAPIFYNDVDPSEYTRDETDWIIGDNVDVGKAFQAYQAQMAEEANSKEIHVESDTHGIFALSNILLIKHDQSSPSFQEHLPNSMLRAVEDEVKQKFGIVSYNSATSEKITRHFDLDQDSKHELENITKSVARGEMTCKQASKKIHNLTSDDPDANPDDMLILGIRNLIESIPKIKTKELVRESSLSASYVNSILNPLFTSPDKNKLLAWSNVKVIADDSMQPDFVVYDLISSHFHGPLVVGDLKGEDRKEDSHDCLVDLLRIGMISGESINKNNYDGVVGVHVVGLQITFYIITLMANGIYVMLEVCSVSLPRDFTELRSYIATMEDILLVIHYYSHCTPSLDPCWFEQNKKKMLQEYLFLNMINCGKIIVASIQPTCKSARGAFQDIEN